MASIVTLKKRAEFLRLRGGQRWSTPICVVETKPTPEGRNHDRAAPAGPRPDDAGETASAARFGFTITRQVGNAVVRNKLRRRLKAIVGQLADGHARPGHDYVIVVRPAAAALSYQDLAKDVSEAFARVHRASARRRK